MAEGLDLDRPQVEEPAGSGLRSVEHVLVGHYGLRVRIVDPYINMARLGSMQRDGHSPASSLSSPKSHVRSIGRATTSM